MPVRIIVCGGRDYADRAFVFQVLDKIHALRGIAELIQGDAPGVDTLAKEWAEARGIKHIDCPAPWDDLDMPGARIKTNSRGKKYVANAGPIRNRHMLTLKPDGVVCFPGGKGSADMASAATEAGVPVYYPSPSGQP